MTLSQPQMARMVKLIKAFMHDVDKGDLSAYFQIDMPTEPKTWKNITAKSDAGHLVTLDCDGHRVVFSFDGQFYA